jgi:hypothetical protein
MRSHGAREGRAQPRWLAEGILVVVSIAVGYAVAQFGEYRDDRRLATRMLTSIEAELAHNLAVLEPLVTVHQEWVTELAAADLSNGSQSGLDVYFATRPELPADASSPFPFLRRSAWDAALAGGALRLIDYDVTAALSDTYRLQEITTENVNRLATGALSTTATYDPASRVASVKLLWLTLADIASAEAILLDLYRKTLPVIAHAAGVEQ